MGVGHAQTSMVDPGLYDIGTSNTEFAGRGSLEFDPPTRGNVWIIGNATTIASEPTRPSNPWTPVLGQPQPFELDYNVDTGDISWSLLGTTLTGNHALPAGTGLAYLIPLSVIQTPAGAPDNLTKLSDVTVAVNGGLGTNWGDWAATDNSINDGVIYFTQYDVHTVKVTGSLTFDVPAAWPGDINGAYADITVASATPVPEPATLAVVGIGLAAVARKRRNPKSKI